MNKKSLISRKRKEKDIKKLIRNNYEVMRSE